jgi:hypothetical protein
MSFPRAVHSMRIEDLLTKFNHEYDIETPVSWYRTKAPSIAEFAYLNLIFKPTDAEVRAWAARLLQLPGRIRQFHAQYNGVRLFEDSLNVFGCLPEGYQSVRTNVFGHPPFDIVRMNAEFRNHLQPLGLVAIGIYGFDGSLVCMSRDEPEVTCFYADDMSRVRRIWLDFDEWLSSEIVRIGSLFDENGKLKWDPSDTVPGPEQ